MPFHHGAHVVDRLPDAAMSVIDGESHLGGLGIAEEVLSAVMSLGRCPATRPGQYWCSGASSVTMVPTTTYRTC